MRKPGLCTQNTPIHIAVYMYLLYVYDFRQLQAVLDSLLKAA